MSCISTNRERYEFYLKEAKCIARCAKAGIDTPTIYWVDTVNRRLWLEFVDGITVKQRFYNGVSEQGTVSSPEIKMNFPFLLCLLSVISLISFLFPRHRKNCGTNWKYSCKDA